MSCLNNFLTLSLIKYIFTAEDLPIFPVSDRHLQVVKERVDLARDVDKLELKNKRTSSEIGWMKKTAEEMDMIIDGFEEGGSELSDDEDAFQIERNKNVSQLNSKRIQLATLLQKPLFPRGFSFKYPTASGKLDIPKMQFSEGQSEQGNNSAVKALKKSIEEIKLAKRQRNKKK